MLPLVKLLVLLAYRCGDVVGDPRACTQGDQNRRITFEFSIILQYKATHDEELNKIVQCRSTVPVGNYTRRVVSGEPRLNKGLPLGLRNLLAVSFVHTCLCEIIASFFQSFQQFCHVCLSCIVPAMLIHFCTARRRQLSQSLRKLCARVRVRSVILCRGPRAERAPLSACEWSLPTAGACPFDVVDVLVCDLFWQQESKSNAIIPSGTNAPVKHTGRASTALPSQAISGLLRAIRDYRLRACAESFLPVPGLQAAVPDPGPLHCTEHTQARAAVLEAATQVDHGLCTPANVATRAACTSSCVRSGWRGQSHSKRKGVVKIIVKMNSGTKRRR